MIHKLTIGHFDLDALYERKLVVLRPLEMSTATRILQELGELKETECLRLGGHPIEIKEGYIVCPWLMPFWIVAAEVFVKRLQQETGCVTYDAGRRAIVTLEQMDKGW